MSQASYIRQETRHMLDKTLDLLSDAKAATTVEELREPVIEILELLRDVASCLQSLDSNDDDE
jgi:hypothetical protein